jgi:hypothetical protein
VNECKEPAVVKRDGERETENERETWNEKKKRGRRGGCPRAGNDVGESKCLDSIGEVGGSYRLQSSRSRSRSREERGTRRKTERERARVQVRGGLKGETGERERP